MFRIKLTNHFLFMLGSMLLAMAGGTLGCGALPPANPSEDFVKASVVVAGPGETLYSCAGHACFRMQCPSAGMDYCFSYESEDVAERVLSFLGGNLKMGMTAVPTADYIANYEKEGRSVAEYALDLPISVKQNLWRVLDEYVDQGMELPYDYIERGCAISIFHILKEAIGNRYLEIGDLPPVFDLSRREILTSELKDSPWTRLAINVLTNGSANDEVFQEEKAITPAVLIELLKNSRLSGRPLISAPPVQKVRETKRGGKIWFTPTMAAWIVLLLTIVSAFAARRYMLRFLVMFQFLLGCVNIYLVFVSSLCATEWSWLLIPFNPLPALLWKWRGKWETSYGTVILVWSGAMLLIPHSLTDPALVLMALSTGISYMADRWMPKCSAEHLANRFAFIPAFLKSKLS